MQTSFSGELVLNNFLHVPVYFLSVVVISDFESSGRLVDEKVPPVTCAPQLYEQIQFFRILIA